MCVLHIPGCERDPCTCSFILDLEKEVSVYFRVLVVGLLILGSEIIGAFVSGSLALASDAGHVFIDLTVVGSACAITARELRMRKTNMRLRLLGTCIQVALLLLVATLIVVEAMSRLDAPPAVQPLPLFIAACAGLIGNAFQYHLSGEAKNRLHKGINVHIVSDFACSFVAVLSAPLIWLFKSSAIDIVFSCVIAGAILVLGLPAILRKEHHSH